MWRLTRDDGQGNLLLVAVPFLAASPSRPSGPPRPPDGLMARGPEVLALATSWQSFVGKHLGRLQLVGPRAVLAALQHRP
jgi:hypothetical protein